MAYGGRAGSRIPDIGKYDDKPGFRSDVGPYVGIVKNNIDVLRKGRLQVYVPELCGVDPDDSTKWRTVSYATPFGGYTVPKDSEENTFDTTRQSYGMWFTPPDLETEVLCIFVQGDPGRGYYFAAIYSDISQYMVPGLGSSQNYNPNNSAEQSQYENIEQLPVGEYNPAVEERSFLKTDKPIHTSLAAQLRNQGLITDQVRGTTSSSSQRETPSRVFGISTPGRPQSDVIDQTNSFTEFGNVRPTQTRKHGHSFVMDDGDMAGANQLVKLKSAGGHQILLHDSEGVIYIGNSTGTAWLEFTASGKIEMYSADGVSLRAKEMNFHCDEDFNVYAGRNITMVGNAATHIQGSSMDVYATGSTKITSDGTMNISGSSANIESSGAMNLKAGGNINQEGSCINLNSGSANSAEKAVNKNTQNKVDVVFNPTLGWTADGTLRTVVNRVPTHEPWPLHDDLGTTETAAEILSEISESGSEVSNITSSSNPTPRPGLESATQTDDFVTELTDDIIDDQPQIGTIGPLTTSEVQALMAAIGFRESGNDYRVINSIGFAGKYQFGVAALEDMGHIKPGSTAQGQRLRNEGSLEYANAIMTDPDIWTGRDSVNSLEQWRNNGPTQENTMFRFLTRNYDQMVRLGVIKTDDDNGTIAGLLTVAHLLGVGGARDWSNGEGGSDAYGTSGTEYFLLGKNAVDRTNIA